MSLVIIQYVNSKERAIPKSTVFILYYFKKRDLSESALEYRTVEITISIVPIRKNMR